MVKRATGDGVTDFASLRDALDDLRTDLDAYSRTVSRGLAGVQLDTRELWDDIADLRDDLGTVSHRVESLMRAVMADPKDVADAIIRHEGGGAE